MTPAFTLNFSGKTMLNEYQSSVPWWIQQMLALSGGALVLRLIDFYRERRNSKDKSDRLEQRQDFARDQAETGRLWETIGAMRAEMEVMKGEIKQLRHEKHQALNVAHDLRLENLTLQVEVNEGLEREGKPAKYDMSAKPAIQA